MRSLGLWKVLLIGTAALGALSVVHSVGADPARSTASSAAADSACSDDSGLQLPPGFCATIFADGIGHARQMVVAPNGVLYVNTWSGSYFPAGEAVHEGGFLVALQDKSGSGKADVIERFGATIQTGAGGSGIDLYNGAIYAELNDRIVKYDLPAGSLVPTGPEITVVSGLPLGGDHPMHPFLIGPDGSLYVDVATATNACQLKNRQLKSPGITPCTELETRGGVWKFDAKKTDQKFSPAERYATGIRNAEGFGYDSAGKMLYVTQHGRDQLHANWPDLYQPEQEATLPSEEVVLLKKGGDYGWPECYYDPWQGKLMLAPEYGGDGHTVGVCASKTAPAAAFPAHWGPNGMVFYDKAQFPARYRGGLFIAFHGSWDRAPYPQGGYNIVFQSLSGGHSAWSMRDFCRRFRWAGKVSGQGCSSPVWGGSWARRVALCFRRYSGPNLQDCLQRRRRYRRSERHAMPKSDGSGRRHRQGRRQAAGRNASGRRSFSSTRGNAGDGRTRQSHLSRRSWRRDVHRMPWRECRRKSSGPRPDQEQMAMERRQLDGHREVNHRWSVDA